MQKGKTSSCHDPFGAHAAGALAAGLWGGDRTMALYPKINPAAAVIHSSRMKLDKYNWFTTSTTQLLLFQLVKIG